ncbi:hypothetical protein ACFZ8E_24965 [Methylobacterium sp. HMF5984]|uniref:hypothetical protein n=1 Tax=Methylobacterium sp. HMF5984 TaxID=3367370 RepID=UPI00385227E1
MPVRASSSLMRGLIVAFLIAPFVWLAIALIVVAGGSLALWVADLPLMPWSPRS